MAVCQNLVPLVNIKIAGKWMFIPLKMVLIGIDPYPNDLNKSTYHTCSSMISMNEKTDDQPLDLLGDDLGSQEFCGTSPESMADQQVGPSPGRDVRCHGIQTSRDVWSSADDDSPTWESDANVFDHGTYGTVWLYYKPLLHWCLLNHGSRKDKLCNTSPYDTTCKVQRRPCNHLSSSFHRPTIWASKACKVLLVTTSSQGAAEWYLQIPSNPMATPGILSRYEGPLIWNTLPPKATPRLDGRPANAAPVTWRVTNKEDLVGPWQRLGHVGSSPALKIDYSKVRWLKTSMFQPCSHFPMARRAMVKLLCVHGLW